MKGRSTPKQAPGQSISVKISVAQYKMLRAVADRNDRGIGAELRRAIRAYLESENGRG